MLGMTSPFSPTSGNQPPPKKGLSTGKIVLIVAGSLLALCCGGGAIAVALNAGKAAKTSPGTAGGAQKTSPGTAGGAQKPGAAAVHAKLNQAARDGKFEFTVTKTTCGTTQVGSQYLNKSAQGQFCLVTVTVKNTGANPQMFDGSSQKAKGAGGVSYGPDTAAGLYVNDGNQTFLNNINPGNAVMGVLVFDIPKGATLSELELHDSPFSGGVIVDLT